MLTRRRTYAFRRRMKLRRPLVPNFLMLAGGATVPVGDVDDKTLRQIGRDWANALVANARRQRRNAENVETRINRRYIRSLLREAAGRRKNGRRG